MLVFLNSIRISTQHLPIFSKGNYSKIAFFIFIIGSTHHLLSAGLMKMQGWQVYLFDYLLG